MADWYVYQHDAAPLGPLSTERIAEAILGGSFSPEVWIAAPGGPRWLRAVDVPVIATIIDGMPTRPRRDSTLVPRRRGSAEGGTRDSGLRIVPAHTSANDEVDAVPDFGGTMMMVDDAELSVYEATPPSRAVEDAIPTQPGLPPIHPSDSSAITGDTLDAFGPPIKRTR